MIDEGHENIKRADGAVSKIEAGLLQDTNQAHYPCLAWLVDSYWF